MQLSYTGMTLNERIVLSGQLADWDRAIHSADRLKIIGILTSVDLGNQVELLANQILSNPEFYGYHVRQRWLAKFEHRLKWNFCLNSANMPRNRRDDDEAHPP